MEYKLFIKRYDNMLILKGKDGKFYQCNPPYERCFEIHKLKYAELVYGSSGMVYPNTGKFYNLNEIRDQLEETQLAG